MKKQAMIVTGLLIIVLVLPGSGLISGIKLVAAGTGQAQQENQLGATRVIEDLPPTQDLPKTGNKNLDSRLNRLVEAEKRGLQFMLNFYG